MTVEEMAECTCSLFYIFISIRIIPCFRNRWVDYQAECPIPRTTDGRHQFQGNVAVTGAAATPNTRSQFSALTMLQFIGNKVASVAASLIWYSFISKFVLEFYGPRISKRYEISNE